MRSLTPHQQRFCEEYLVDSNATQAYLWAGYKASRSARHNAARLTTKDNIRAEVARLRTARSERTQITADQVLEEWAELGFARVGDPNVSAAVKKSALDSIAKHLGMFEKKPPESQPVLIQLNMGCPPDDEDMPRQIPAGPLERVGDASAGLAAM